MYDKSDKRRLHWLIDQYLSGEINEPSFCDEFYYSYDLGIDRKTLTESESKIFENLSMVASRFSPHEEDHKLDARAFATKQELGQEISNAKKRLTQ